MNIVVITDANFTKQTAVVNRLNAYSRGLGELGNQVYMLALDNDQNSLEQTIEAYPAINYIGFGKKTSTNGISRYKNLFFSGKAAARWIKKKHTKEKISALIYYGMLAPARPSVSPICVKHGIPTYDEITEYPFLGRQKKLYRRLEYWFFMNHFVLKNSGILCISTGLKRFMEEHLRAKKSAIPVKWFCIMLDTDKFQCPNDPTAQNSDFFVGAPFLVYCGSMYGEKDGVPDLIRAFSMAAETNDRVRLVIIGDNSNKQKMKHINQAMAEVKCGDRIIFTGRIDWSEMHSYMCGATALVLAKPANQQNEGAFPTKLGEYLACGKPIICTAEGDITMFLKHEKNALLAKPGVPSDFAQQILRCVEDSRLREQLSQGALLLAHETFSHLHQAQYLIDLFKLEPPRITQTALEAKGYT